MNATHPKPPGLPLSLSELPRAGIEFGQLAWRLRRIVKHAPKGQGLPVLTLPGYGGGDESMAGIRWFLTKLNYTCYKMDLGRNLEARSEKIMSVDDATAFREKMTTKVTERLQAIYESEQQPVILIGWSMGGLFALDAAQAKPEYCKRVVTLGSPFGDPRGTSTWKLLRALNRSKVPVEQQNFSNWLTKRSMQNNQVPITVLYSNKDGIVAPAVARLEEHSLIEHVEVDSSHVGFAFNDKVYVKLADLLSQNN